MNIFRSKYRITKEELRAFGERIKNVNSEARYSAGFWAQRLNCIKDVHAWDYVITLYLADWCSDEEREFIEMSFFRNESVPRVCEKFYISEALYFYRRDRILTDIIGLAVQYGIVTFRSERRSEAVAAVGEDDRIDIAKWIRIEKLVTGTLKRKTGNIRSAVTAMLYMERHKIPWRGLPREYGDWNGVYKRYIRWRKIGLWDKILKIIELEE